MDMNSDKTPVFQRRGKYKSLSDETKDSMLKLYHKGLSQNEIVGRVDVASPSVRYWLKKMTDPTTGKPFESIVDYNTYNSDQNKEEKTSQQPILIQLQDYIANQSNNQEQETPRPTDKIVGALEDIATQTTLDGPLTADDYHYGIQVLCFYAGVKFGIKQFGDIAEKMGVGRAHASNIILGKGYRDNLEVLRINYQHLLSGLGLAETISPIELNIAYGTILESFDDFVLKRNIDERKIILEQAKARLKAAKKGHPQKTS